MAKKFLGKQPSKIDFRSGVGDADTFVRSGRWTIVKSSNVRRIMYDAGMQRLLVEFKNNSLYQYNAVPRRIAREMYTASSMGRYVWRRLRDKYAFVKLRAGRQGERDG